MDHVAILSKKLKLLDKIISGEKTIESRWYRSKKPPFGSITVGDKLYFKESGEPVSVKAEAEKVLFFENLTPKKIKEILLRYGSRIGVGVSYYELIKEKKFCTLVFLKDVKEIPAFSVDKKGFGMMTAWLTVDSIDMIRENLI